MPANRFEKYDPFKKDLPYKPNNTKIETAYWDEPFVPFDPIDKWGTLAENFSDIIDFINEAAEALRRYKPKNIKAMHHIAQDTGELKLGKLFGSNFLHREIYLEVTKKTKKPVLRVLHSYRKLKKQIEDALGVCEARTLYHDICVALRYLNETDEIKEGTEGYLYESSSNYLSCSNYVGSPEIDKKKIFKLKGFVIAGDLPAVGPYPNRIEEIVAELNKIKSPKNKTTIHSKEPLAKPTPAEQRAWESYDWVCKNYPDLLPLPDNKKNRIYNKQMYEKAIEESPFYHDEEDKLFVYPNFDSWKRNIRGYIYKQTNSSKDQEEIREPQSGQVDNLSELSSKYTPRGD